MPATHTISTTSRRELSSSSPHPPPPQGKLPKEIHAILTEKLACFLHGRAQDSSAPLYWTYYGVRSPVVEETVNTFWTKGTFGGGHI